MLNNAAAATTLAKAGQASAAGPDPIVYVIAIVLMAGLISGAAAYLTQPSQADPALPPLPRTPWYTFCLLGVIAAACVPLFLSVVESSLMKDILKGGEMVVQSLLIFLGLCLLTALTARTFLDSLTRRILQQMEEIKDRQDKAAQERSAIRKDVDAVQETVEKVGETVDEADAPPAQAALDEAISPASLPSVDDEERKLIQALGKKEYRTVGGVVDDTSLLREDVKQRLPALALKGIATPTASSRTGGIRWMLTPAGRAILQNTKS